MGPRRGAGSDAAKRRPGFSQGPTVDQIFWFNPNAFVRPANGTFGNAPRNLITGPGFQTWDIAFLKNILFGKPSRVQFRAEIFNFPNHPNLNNPNTDPTSADFGRALAKEQRTQHPAGREVLLLDSTILPSRDAAAWAAASSSHVPARYPADNSPSANDWQSL